MAKSMGFHVAPIDDRGDELMQRMIRNSIPSSASKIPTDLGSPFMNLVDTPKEQFRRKLPAYSLWQLGCIVHDTLRLFFFFFFFAIMKSDLFWPFDYITLL